MSEDGAAPQPKPDPFERLTGLLGKLGALGAAAVTINTTVNGWFEQSIARTAAFRQAVAAEETFWSTLHADYVSTFETDMAANTQLRDEKRIAICSLANKPSATFKEYSDFAVPSGMKRDAAERVAGMRALLREGLLDRKTSGDLVADKCGGDAFVLDQKAVSRSPDGTLSRAAMEEIATMPVAMSGAVLQTEVIAQGRPNGWDVDVFWCQGDNEIDNREAARRTAFKLVGNSGQVAPRVLLGRVRLRALPVERQAAELISESKTFVAWDEGDGEKHAAEEILEKRLNTVPADKTNPEITFDLQPTPARTPWYLSVFVCRPAPQS